MVEIYKTRAMPTDFTDDTHQYVVNKSNTQLGDKTSEGSTVALSLPPDCCRRPEGRYQCPLLFSVSVLGHAFYFSHSIITRIITVFQAALNRACKSYFNLWVLLLSGYFFTSSYSLFYCASLPLLWLSWKSLWEGIKQGDLINSPHSTRPVFCFSSAQWDAPLDDS